MFTHAQLSRRLSLREIHVLHLARLALGYSDDEERHRSIQVIAALLAAAPRTLPDGADYDVFLSYSRADVDPVRAISQRLVAHGVTPWFDLWAIQPGERWISALEAAIPKIEMALVFVGSGGLGPWQNLEVQALMKGMVEASRHVIAVLLPGASMAQVPTFLSIMNVVALDTELDVGALVHAVKNRRVAI